MSLLGFGKLFGSNNHASEYSGIRMQNGAPGNLSFRTYDDKIVIYGTPETIGNLIPKVAPLIVNYALDMKKNSKQ